MCWLTEPVVTSAVRLSDRSPDEGLGSSIAAPRGSLRSSLSHRIESNDTDRSVDIIESSEADRVPDTVETGDAALASDLTVDTETVADDNELADTETDPRSEGSFHFQFDFVLN